MSTLQVIQALLLIFVTRGCSVHAIEHLPVSKLYDSVDNTYRLLLSIDRKKMGLCGLDEKRIERFVSRAKPTEEIRWRRSYKVYRLTSQTIFLNERSLICRTYQLKATSLLPLVKPITCKETACRNLDGQWRTVV